MNELKIENLELEELLLLFLNVKGMKTKSSPFTKGSDVPNWFQLDTSIKSSKKSKRIITPTFTENTMAQFCTALNAYYNFNNVKFETSGQVGVKLTFNNDRQQTITEFLHSIYLLISQKILNVTAERFSELFALSTFAFRGSLDISHHFYTTDLHRSRASNKQDLEQFIKLLMQTNLNEQLNLNFRELQGEGDARETQIRINLRYFKDNYLDALEPINPYKYSQFVLNIDEINRHNAKNPEKARDAFLNRLKFYQNNIVGAKTLDAIDVSKFREMLKLSDGDDNGEKKRSNSAKELAVVNRPDYCVCCHKAYKTEDRTFKYRNSESWYFEYHHVISFGNKTINTESPDNYAKLCPACHRALTPHRADEKYQKQLIENILNEPSYSDALQFVINVQKSVRNTEEPVEFVFSNLK